MFADMRKEQFREPWYCSATQPKHEEINIESLEIPQWCPLVKIKDENLFETIIGKRRMKKILKLS